jgi:ribosomal protein S18 acetylase RimI-like enzyme
VNISLRPASDLDFEFAFQVKKDALGPYIEQVWGWDETFQRRFHLNDWAQRRPEIVECDGQAVGTLDVVRHPDHLYIGDFYLLPSHQRRGIGSALLSRVLRQADRAKLPVRLEFLKVNPVRSLYERHAFRITGESPTHYLAERQIAQDSLHLPPNQEL